MWYSPPNRAVSFEQRESPRRPKKNSKKRHVEDFDDERMDLVVFIVTCSDKSTKAGA